MTTPRKLRTTAIAALVAVSTTFASVTPVFADEAGTTNVTNDNSRQTADANSAAGLNIYDGSKLPTGVVVTEDILLVQTNKTEKRIQDFWGSAKASQAQQVAAQVFANYNNPNALDDTEHGALVALEAQYKAITEALKKAAQDEANATVSVQAALNADNLARQKAVEFDNAAEALLNDSEVRRIGALVNQHNETKLANIPTALLPFSQESLHKQVMDWVKIYRAHFNNLRDYEADPSSADRVERYYAQYLEEYMNNPKVKKAYDLYQGLLTTAVPAQAHDIIVLQLFQNRTRAQVEVLRALQAYYAVAVRMIQLYENDTLQADQKKDVKSAYYDAIFRGKESFDKMLDLETAQLKKADVNVNELFNTYESDQGNSVVQSQDAEQKAYEAWRDAEAKRTYDNMVANRWWQNELETAQLIDRAAFAKKADGTALESLKNQLAAIQAQNGQLADAAKKAEERIAELQKVVNDQTKPSETPKPTPKPGTSSKDQSSNNELKVGQNKDSSADTKTIGIAVLIAAILGALAAAFPHIQNMLPKM